MTRVEQPAFLLAQAQVIDRAAQVGLVEDPDDHLLAPAGDGDGGDPEVHLVPVHPDGRPAIVGVQRIGDIQPGKDLGASDQRGAGRAGQSHDLAQHPVHPVADDRGAILRLRVHVTRALAHCLRDHRVHQLGYRRVEDRIPLFLHGHVDSRIHLGGLQPAQQTLNAPLRAVDRVDLFLQQDGGADLILDLPPRHEPDRLLGVEVARIGGGEPDIPVVGGEWQDAVLAGDGLGHQQRRPRIGGAEVRDLELELAGYGFGDGRVVGQAGIDDLEPHAPVRGERDRLTLGQDAAVHQDRQQPAIVYHEGARRLLGHVTPCDGSRCRSGSVRFG